MKSAPLLAKLKVFKGIRKADIVAQTLSDAATKGAKVTQTPGKIIIQEGDEITTIEKTTDDVIIVQRSKYGQRLEDIGEVLPDGRVKGRYSKRTFDPNKAGGPIVKLDWKLAKIDKTGINNIKKHLARLEPDDWNQAMIKRLEDIEAGKLQVTDFDKRFYTHELDEFNRYKELGYETTNYSQIPDDVWNNAHSATLEDYAVYEIIEYQGENIRSLYHPEVQK